MQIYDDIKSLTNVIKQSSSEKVRVIQYSDIKQNNGRRNIVDILEFNQVSQRISSGQFNSVIRNALKTFVGHSVSIENIGE